jgi:hypothetical protein
MTVTRSRDQRNAREVIPLEAAVCIQKENGDIIIRQRRGKSILGLVLSLIIGLSGLAFLIIQLSPSTQFRLDFSCAGIGMLLLGMLVIWVSTRALSAPNITIDVTNQAIEIHPGLGRTTQIWPFSVVEGVHSQSRIQEQVLLNIAEAFIAPQYSSTDSQRTIISLQHTDGQEIYISTATKEAATRVPVMIAAALGKSVFTK